ncbi:hypothetical protein [Trinickia acidisoli]|uniref:hypothetical protein n=1 Tax=Trinickia acidisoli TaxID=2767482 RepID=UPI001A8C60F5|nr:hypothetical protein [Trinickia acidisoli]
MSGDRPLVQHTACIDLPGEPVDCWAETDLTVLLRKHRDVIFDIELKKGATYSVEATQDWMYDVKKKKRVQKGQFQDGERYHLWVGRDFKGELVLSMNGSVLHRYSLVALNLQGESSDPKVKPAPLILTLGSQPGSRAQAQSTAAPQQSVSLFAKPSPLVCRNTNGELPGDAWWGGMIPLDFGVKTSASTAATMPASLHAHAEEESVGHVFEVSLTNAPAEVVAFVENGGEDTALDTNKIVTRNWLIGQLAGGTSFVKDNVEELRDLWNRSFRLMQIVHPKAGAKTYVVFRGNAALRKVITGTRYAAKNSKILAITAGAGTFESVTAAAWEAGKGAFKRATGVALVFTIALDTAEWYRDYSKVDKNGEHSKDLFDLFAKVGVDLVGAGIAAVVSTAVVGALTTGLLAAGLIAGAPIWAVGALVFGAAVAVGYLINVADNEFHITKRVADSLREAAQALEKRHSKDYSGYSLMFTSS